MYAVFFYLGALTASAMAAQGLRRGKEMRVPYATLLLCVALAVCLLVQLAAPAALLLFERDAGAIGSGEWWRILTALFFQDGGLRGGASNIFFLAIIGSLAEQMVRRKHWLLIYFGTGIAAELAGIYLQPVGAGNSVAVFGLAAAICACAYARKTDASIRAFSAASAACALVLLAMRDIHGAAFFIGIAISCSVFAFSAILKSRFA